MYIYIYIYIYIFIYMTTGDIIVLTSHGANTATPINTPPWPV